MAKSKSKTPQTDLERIYADIRKQVKRRYENRAEFISHFLAFVVFNLGLWLFFRPESGSVWYAIALFITFGWTIGILIHGVQAYFEEMSERAVLREFEQYAPPMDKTKRYYEEPRERLVAISEDGELFALDEEEEDSLQA